MRRDYSLSPVTDLSEWKRFLVSSPQESIFSYPAFLDALDVPYRFFFLHKGDEIKAAISLITDPNGQQSFFHDLVIYNGLMFSPPPPEQNFAQTTSEQFQSAEAAIFEITQRFETLQMALSPTVTDLRPFQWFHYHEPDKGQFSLDLRYTSLVDISSLARSASDTESPLFAQLGSSRRQEIRAARCEGARAEVGEHVDILLALYCETLERQKITVAPLKLRQMQSVMRSLLRSGQGHLFSVSNSKGQVESAAFFAKDSHRAYYLFGATRTEKSLSYGGSILIWDALLHLAKLGITEVDLEGVNSPKRGWFKLSFGGNLTPYYQVSWHRGGVVGCSS